MKIVHGVHQQLEEQANRLLAESLQGVTRPADKSDILTPWKEQDRRSKEIYVSSGTPERSAREGLFHRAINPNRLHLNSATPASLAQHRNAVRGWGRRRDEPSKQQPRGATEWDFE